MKTVIPIMGRYRVQHWRDNKLLWSKYFKNAIVDEGANNILDVQFGGSAASDPWNFGLIDNAGSPSLLDADTMASHAGWTELTAYTEGTRQVWDDDAASGRVKTNTTDAVFTMNAANTIHGIFLSNDNVKGGTTGLLWATAAFVTPLVVANLDVVRVQYTLTVG